ncbi:MAG: DUF2167 domain-containing protein [Erythrobacter sp.]|uniref:DUF2167 domain-containing protein n=1 Tax=Erythrobacter sp. TaxID=1042 RepID=UPI0025E20926|nr:DUF2167 domain-containing protein [Erythrobacter sp.]MCL9999942.1 DUF2167 domain-containing protein [Erythrobacter sp.]
MRFVAALLAVLAAFFAVPIAAQAPAEGELPPEVVKLLDSLNPVNGKVGLPEARATLDLGEEYIFYGKEDAAKILVQLWGNPPQAAEGVLGLVMPKGSTPASDAWGAVVSFEKTGYVSDEDAATTDYDELLTAMQEGTNEANTARAEAGYPTIALVGWAESPTYDKATHSVVWAQNLRFSDSDKNGLNYDVRTLGRYGVLSLNLISSMDKLGEVRVAAKQFAQHANFDAGARYGDFDPATDAAAEYGIGGLIAAGAGVAVAKKLGLFGTIGVFLVKFLKPILVGVALLFGGLWQAFKGRLFGRRQEEEVYEDPGYDETGPEAGADAEAEGQGGFSLAKSEDPGRE